MIGFQTLFSSNRIYLIKHWQSNINLLYLIFMFRDCVYFNKPCLSRNLCACTFSLCARRYGGTSLNMYLCTWQFILFWFSLLHLGIQMTKMVCNFFCSLFLSFLQENNNVFIIAAKVDDLDFCGTYDVNFKVITC